LVNVQFVFNGGQAEMEGDSGSGQTQASCMYLATAPSNFLSGTTLTRFDLQLDLQVNLNVSEFVVHLESPFVKYVVGDFQLVPKRTPPWIIISKKIQKTG
jgi:hypothetical protein